MNRKENTVFCYYAHNSVWTCELGYGADTMFHRTYFLFVNKLEICFWLQTFRPFSQEAAKNIFL